MSKKELNEVTLAALMGAVLGVILGIVLVREFGLSEWATVIIAGIVGALAGGICYRPSEVRNVVFGIARYLRDGFLSAGKRIKNFVTKPATSFDIPITAEIRNTCSSFAGAVKKHRRGIFKFFYGVSLVVMFVVVSRFTLGWIWTSQMDKEIPEYIRSWFGGPLIGFFEAIFFLVFMVALLGATGGSEKPSWWMPISIRIGKRIHKWDVESSSGDIGQKFTVTDFLALWLVVSFAPVIGAVGLPLSLFMLVVDAIITMACALASTGRLASMAGGLIGTIVGVIFYFNGFHHLTAIGAGAIIGGLSGRWIYALRVALTYKNPEPQLRTI